VAAARALLKEVEALRPVEAGGRPVFRWDRAEYALFYTPGYLEVVGLGEAEWFEKRIGASSPHESLGKEGSELRRRAELAVAQARQQQEAVFSPECLTLYMNNACNLRCAYCYADPGRYAAEAATSKQGGVAARPAYLGMDVIGAAAELVAQNCQRKGRPFYVVFHGGGEPTLHRERVERALGLVERAAAAHGVELFRYVATNGVMSEKKAVWLARRFDLVGLSCDGPEEIQNRLRPLWEGGPTAGHVERTARILQAEGQRVHVRATVARECVGRQAEIAAYVCERLAPEEIHLEPVYTGGRADTAAGLRPQEATDFVDHFLEARRKAQDYGVRLTYAGCRPDQVHGPYCNVSRQVLNLVPGGVATACFKLTEGGEAEARGMSIGAWERRSGRFVIDHGRVRELRRRLASPPAQCQDCFNRYHCAGECPDRCALDAASGAEERAEEDGFRCQAQKGIAAAMLEEVAEGVWSRVAGGGENGSGHGNAVL
jgi:uncharacterized protein